jgi:anti-anti-sigma factor
MMTVAMINTFFPPRQLDPILAGESQRLGASAVLRVAGEIDLCSAPGLGAQLHAPLAPDQPGGEVVLDPARVSFCNAWRLAVLVDAQRKALSACKRLVLIEPSAVLRRLLSITGPAEVLCVVGEG